jgi:hypothetical protein
MNVFTEAVSTGLPCENGHLAVHISTGSTYLFDFVNVLVQTISTGYCA